MYMYKKEDKMNNVFNGFDFICKKSLFGFEY